MDMRDSEGQLAVCAPAAEPGPLGWEAGASTAVMPQSHFGDPPGGGGVLEPEILRPGV